MYLSDEHTLENVYNILVINLCRYTCLLLHMFTKRNTVWHKKMYEMKMYQSFRSFEIALKNVYSIICYINFVDKKENEYKMNLA